MKLSASDLVKKAHLTGRWRISQQSLISPLLGASLNFEVEHTSQIIINVSNQANLLSPSQYFTARVDNDPWHRWPASQENNQLTLSTDRHHITIMTGGNSDLDDVWWQQQDFKVNSVILDDGAKLWQTIPDKKVLILGDSITAGCWVNGKHASVDYRPESNYVSVAQDLLTNVELQRVAYSAAGVLRPGTGNVPVARQWLSHFDALHTIEPDHYDLVIIALGVNDRRFPQKEFSEQYTRYLQAVIARYQTKIALMVPFLQSFKECIQNIGKQRSIPVITTDGWCQHTVDGLHPDSQGSVEAGQHFAQAIQQLVQ